MQKKRGQGLSMTTIVIAALALLVLIVIILILTGRLSLFSEGLDETSGCETYCKSLGMEASGDIDEVRKENCAEGYPDGKLIPGIKGNTDKKVCCCFRD